MRLNRLCIVILFSDMRSAINSRNCLLYSPHHGLRLACYAKRIATSQIVWTIASRFPSSAERKPQPVFSLSRFPGEGLGKCQHRCVAVSSRWLIWIFFRLKRESPLVAATSPSCPQCPNAPSVDHLQYAKYRRPLSKLVGLLPQYCQAGLYAWP